MVSRGPRGPRAAHLRAVRFTALNPGPRTAAGRSCLEHKVLCSGAGVLCEGLYGCILSRTESNIVRQIVSLSRGQTLNQPVT